MTRVFNAIEWAARVARSWAKAVRSWRHQAVVRCRTFSALARLQAA